ncbi:hypothetical protein SAMD00019534_005640, partial [Acytostelium subglobosum LB1]|uniref:hypothetical protein n=1 Tax=Acytostelium subglobosum LB1 TaxID=1410327 RepID=UPI000644AB71
YKFNQIQYVSNDSDIVNTMITETKENSYQWAIYNTSLAFTILAWLIVFIQIGLVVLYLFDIMRYFPSITPKISKVLPFISLIFCLISMFAFLGLPLATKKDCLNVSFKNDRSCQGGANSQFLGNEKLELPDNIVQYNSWGPDVGWCAQVVATSIVIIGSVLNYTHCKYIILPK